jgi:hypothetical protein
MKIKYLENNLEGISQPKNDSTKKINRSGVEYTYVGKSKEEPALTTRVKALFECFFMTLGSCLVVPCFFKDFRKTFKNAGRELLSGQETVKYYVMNPQVFTKNDKKSSILTVTSAELFTKGLDNSKKALFD